MSRFWCLRLCMSTRRCYVHLEVQRQAKNTVCVSQTVARGSAERGGVERGRQVRSHKTREPTLLHAPSLLCVRKEKLNDSPVPRAFANMRASHQTRTRIRSLAWGTAKDLGFTSRHWAHRDQTWTSCAVFTSEGGNALVFVTHRTSRVLWNGPRNSF